MMENLTHSKTRIPNHTKPYQTIPNHTKEVRGKRKYEEVVDEGKGPMVLSPGVQRFKGPTYLKVTFNYKLDFKKGPSCLAH